MDDMIQMMITGVFKELVSKNVQHEVKGYNADVDTSMEFPIDDECIFKMDLKAKVTVEHVKYSITNKNQTNYGLEEA